MRPDYQSVAVDRAYVLTVLPLPSGAEFRRRGVDREDLPALLADLEDSRTPERVLAVHVDPGWLGPAG